MSPLSTLGTAPPPAREYQKSGCYLLQRMSLFMAQSGHFTLHGECLLSGVKPTSMLKALTSAFGAINDVAKRN